MKDTILVTGGAGFLGSHLVRDLVATGARVRVLELATAPVQHLPLNEIEMVHGDICNRHSVAGAVRGCREVYHLAANPQLWARRKGIFHQVNFLGTVNVLEEALAAGAERVLHTSSIMVLTRVDQVGPQRSQNLFLREVVGPYARSKLRAERHALRLAHQGAPVIVVSPTVPLGPEDYGKTPPTQMLLEYCRGRRQYLDTTLNLIDVRDAARGMIRAMARGVPGKRYLLGHENISLRDLFLRLGRLSPVPGSPQPVPYFLALVAAYVSEFLADVFTHSPPAATVPGVKRARLVLPLDPRADLQFLGLEPRPLEQTLADTLAWFAAMNWLETNKR